MFSKALFKQSCKANGIMWAIISIGGCIILACLMLISGSGSIANLKTGMTSAIVESSIESQMKGRAVNYYLISEQSLENFDEAFLSTYSSYYSQGEDTAKQYAYLAGIQALSGFVDSYATQLGYTSDSSEYLELQGLVFYVINLNPNDLVNNFDEFYTSLGVDAPTYDLTTISVSDRATYRATYAMTNSSIFLAGNMISDDNIESILLQLSSYSVTEEDYKNYTYTNDEGEEVSKFTGESGFLYLNHLANSTIVTFNARLEYEVLLGKDETTAKEEITADLTNSFLSNLSEDVAISLMELGEIDLYGMIVGSIFFKMAGLLLPIIYIIMCSNNLIAGQVDSGAMAYVLSTSTKRRQVIFTQAVYLVSSLFAMFLMTTITSMVCLAFMDSAAVTLGYVDMILLNLGAFITLFAMSGICFLASCWFNRSKYSMSIGGGLNMFFLVATMLGLFGSKVLPSIVRLNSLNFFNYISIISLFDVNSILDGSLGFAWKLAILAVVGLVCYIIGGIKFKKKDLPL